MSKASNLVKLQSAGFNVPPFVVIPAKIFAAYLSEVTNPLSQEAILSGRLNPQLSAQILERSNQLRSNPNGFAVRSSMEMEDSKHHSFAGQFDSFLNIGDEAALLDAVKACWASGFNERATAYREQHNLPSDPGGMEVIIQEMVHAELSGIIFTVDPIRRDPRQMLVSIVKGLGVDLVQGNTTGETFSIHKESGEISGLPEETLNPGQAEGLASIALKIEELFGEPQDIEFSIQNQRIFVLQSRPITTAVPTERILWDNSNITESYSGVTTPLTFSVIRGAYQSVYRQFLELMKAKNINEDVLRNLLGFYHGQVYYQLLNWYKALAHLPAFENNRKFLEQMMGVKQSAGHKTKRSVFGVFPLIAWVGRMIMLQVTSSRRVDDFQRNFNHVLTEYTNQNFSTFTPHQIRATYQDLEKRVLGNWSAPIVTDFLAMIFHGVLRRLNEQWLGQETILAAELLSSSGEIESLDPLRRIQDLAGKVSENPTLLNIFSQTEPHTTLQVLRQDKDHAAFFNELEEYIQLYGDRCINELKLEEPNLHDNPTQLIQMISTAAANPFQIPPSNQDEVQNKNHWPGLNPVKQKLLGSVLTQTRRHIRNRENMRFARTRLFGMLRQLFNSLGHRWEEAGILNAAADIYYLSVHEIWDYVEGTAVSLDLQGLADLRRREYSGYQKDKLPDRFETFGVPYQDSPRDLLTPLMENNDNLSGTGCCSGKVFGRVQVIYDAKDKLDLGGDILVAERTDPGWVFLFPTASGILVERGSPLSHSAIVARELGIPTIVNIPHLTSQIHTGDHLEMDGGKGSISIQSKKEDAPEK